MIARVEAPDSNNPIDFLERYRQKHDGLLAPSESRRLTYEYAQLPTATQFQEHLEGTEAAEWAERWGRVNFWDRARQSNGDYEAGMHAYLNTLLDNGVVKAREIPERLNRAGERLDRYLSFVANHRTEWGRPVVNLWYVGPRLAQVQFDYQGGPRKTGETSPEPHSKIIRKPERFLRRGVEQTTSL